MERSNRRGGRPRRGRPGSAVAARGRAGALLGPEKPGEASIPLRDVEGPAGGLFASPGEGRGEPVEVLVGPGVVVPGAEECQVGREVVGDAVLFKPGEDALLEGSEEALDATVLPGCEGGGALVANAEAAKGEAEETGGEDRLVVGAEDAGAAEAFDGVEGCSEQGDRRAGAELAEGEAGAGAVVEQAKDRNEVRAGRAGR